MKKVQPVAPTGFTDEEDAHETRLYVRHRVHVRVVAPGQAGVVVWCGREVVRDVPNVLEDATWRHAVILLGYALLTVQVQGTCWLNVGTRYVHALIYLKIFLISLGS